MTERGPKRGSGKKVLQDYKKVGKKFVPPFTHKVGPLQAVSYARQILPELIWWDVLIGEGSLRFATKVAEEIGSHLKPREGDKCWWAFISDYRQLDEEAVARLRRHLDQAGLLAQIEAALKGFLSLYPNCPVGRLLDRPTGGAVDQEYLAKFEGRLEVLEDKRSSQSVLMQAQAVYLGFVLDKLKIKKGLALADFPEVEHYPTTERSKEVGVSVCATVNMLAGQMLPVYSDDEWVLYFWKRSYDLRPMSFSHLDEP